MTAQAVRGIPRWLLLALCLIYASVGFLGRVPFKPVELSQMGWMLMESSTTLPLWQQESLFHGLLRPMALSQLSQALPVGLSSETLFMLLKVSAWLILLSVLALTWLASKGFALATAAQPVSFAFGGEAQPNDYALSMADSALLAQLDERFGLRLDPRACRFDTRDRDVEDRVHRAGGTGQSITHRSDGTLQQGRRLHRQQRDYIRERLPDVFTRRVQGLDHLPSGTAIGHDGKENFFIGFQRGLPAERALRDEVVERCKQALLP